MSYEEEIAWGVQQMLDADLQFPQDVPVRKVVKTTADHIRSMTDEELADFMSEHSIEDFCYIICGGECKAVATFNKTSGQRCREIVSNWLKQPYKEAEDG